MLQASAATESPCCDRGDGYTIGAAGCPLCRYSADRCSQYAELPSFRGGGHKRKPILLRGHGATIEEWLMAAEYIMVQGSLVILCERGLRPLETQTREYPGFERCTHC